VRAAQLTMPKMPGADIRYQHMVFFGGVDTPVLTANGAGIIASNNALAI